jgi:hypothetical protein
MKDLSKNSSFDSVRRVIREVLINESGYVGEHQAPDKESGDPMWNVTKVIYPKDFYTGVGLRYYGTGSKLDASAYSKIMAVKGRQDALVKIYRAFPKSLPRQEKQINTGDWVTIERGYAVEHGNNNLLGDFSIVSKTVHARDLFTNGDSFLEWGYVPQPMMPKNERDLEFERFPGRLQLIDKNSQMIK